MSACPHCRWPLGVTEAAAGTTVVCGQCGASVAIPRAADGATAIVLPAPRGESVWALVMTLQFWGWTLTALLVVAIAVALLLPAVGSSRGRPSGRITAMNNLKQLGLAAHNYAYQFKQFPSSYSVDTTGKPLLSWRVHLLPYFDRRDLYNKFHLDEPWDSPHNATFIADVPYIYLDPGGRVTLPGHTCFQAIVGPRAVMQSPIDPFTGKTLDGVGPNDLIDGSANTLLFIETDPAEAVIWTKPDDFDYSVDSLTIPDKHGRNESYLVVLADGSVRTIGLTIDPEKFRALCTRDGREVVNEQDWW